MTNATKTLALIFVGTLALALATSWTWSGSSSAAFQEDLLAVDTSAVQGVRIKRSSGNPVTLTRSDTGWSVAPNDTSASYPASANAVNGLLRTLHDLQVSAVPTRQPDNHPRYGVDSTGTTITMLDSDDEALGQLIIGRTRMQRPQSGGQNQNPMQRMQQRQGTPISYVRRPNRPDVYSVEASLQSLSSRTIDDWRDKRIWAVDQSQIQRIDFTFPGDSSFTMQRSAPDDTASAVGPATWTSNGDTLSSTEVSSLLRTIASPEADGFANDLSPSEAGDPRYTIRIHLADGSRRRLNLRPSPEGSTYLATADGFSYVAKLDRNTWDRSVLQGRTSLLKNTE